MKLFHLVKPLLIFLSVKMMIVSLIQRVLIHVLVIMIVLQLVMVHMMMLTLHPLLNAVYAAEVVKL